MPGPSPALAVTAAMLVYGLLAVAVFCASLSELWIRRRATVPAVLGAAVASALWPATLIVLALWARSQASRSIDTDGLARVGADAGPGGR